jgi:hypothetical protein
VYRNKHRGEEEDLEETIQHVLSSVPTAEFFSEIKNLLCRSTRVCEPQKPVPVLSLKAVRENPILKCNTLI